MMHNCQVCRNIWVTTKQSDLILQTKGESLAMKWRVLSMPLQRPGSYIMLNHLTPNQWAMLLPNFCFLYFIYILCHGKKMLSITYFLNDADIDHIIHIDLNSYFLVFCTFE